MSDLKLLMPEINMLPHEGDLDLSGFSDLGNPVILDHPSRDELKTELEDADALFTNRTIVDEDLLAGAKKLRYIGECATGFNNIDVDYCHAHGITVTNVPNYSTSAVAQHVFALILDHFSQVAKYNDFVKEGGWVNANCFSPYAFPMEELAGKTIGLIGYGKTGRAVAKIARAFGMDVLVYTRSFAKAKEQGNTALEGFLDRAEREVTYVTLDNLLKHSDIISLHCPLNADSKNLIDAEAIHKMRASAYFINTARGGIVDNEALVSALNSGKLSGAAIDVLEHEPMDKDCILLDAKNITITPHVGWAPVETRQRLVNEVVKNYKAFLSGKPQNEV